MNNKIKPGQTILQVPLRSPIAVVEAIKPYIKNKAVCELGSAAGDISLEMAKYAKKVIGVEIDKKLVRISRRRGLHTICADATTFVLPKKIDVYYMWMDKQLTRKVFNHIKKGLVIMAAEYGYGRRMGIPRGTELRVLDEIQAEYPKSEMLNIRYNEGNGERQAGKMFLLVTRKKPKKMKNLMIYFNPEKRFSSEAEGLVKRQIDTSLQLGWKNHDIVLLTNFPYEYKMVKAKTVDENLSSSSDNNIQKSNVIYNLLKQRMVKENELWIYHDLDCFQLYPIDGSEISLQGGFAGFIEDDNFKFNMNRIFFKKDSDKVFEWIRNRALRLRTYEAIALSTLVVTNYRNINSLLKVFKPLGIFGHLKFLFFLIPSISTEMIPLSLAL